MTSRIKCPECGNENPRKLHEKEDKDKDPLYYSMQGSPVYPTKIHCGVCGHNFPKPK